MAAFSSWRFGEYCRTRNFSGTCRVRCRCKSGVESTGIKCLAVVSWRGFRAVDLRPGFRVSCGGDILHRIDGGADMLLQPRVQTFRSLAAEYTLPEILLLTRAISLPVYVAALSAVAIWVSKVSTGSGVPWAWKAFAVLMFAATMIINNPIRTPRFLVGTILFSFWNILPWGKWKNAVAVAALVGGFVIVFPFADLFRSSLEASLGHRLEQSTVVRELTQNGDFDAFEIVSNSVLVMDGEDLLLGRQLSGALLFWVPRSSWATKPRPTGEWLAERMGYEYTNLSAPLWTEFYVDGGILLVVLGFAGYGYVGRRLELWNERNMKSDRVEMITLLVAVAAGYQVFLLRGSLMPAVAYLVPMVVLVFALGLRVRWSKHSR